MEAINVFHPAVSRQKEKNSMFLAVIYRALIPDSNKFFSLQTYYGFNVEQIADPLERQAWETMVKTYGQTPAQLFRAAHPLAIQNFCTSSSNGSILPVIEGVTGKIISIKDKKKLFQWENISFHYFLRDKMGKLRRSPG